MAGDPFEPELAAAAAETSRDAAMDAIDELLRVDLVRTTDARDHFASAIRLSAARRTRARRLPGGWVRISGPQMRSPLEGLPRMMRANHVERSARQGDLVAAAILREAGQAAARLAPQSAARWFGGALAAAPAEGADG